MKDVPISQFGTKLHFKKLTPEELRKSASFNLVDNEGKFVAILVVPASAEKRFQFQGLADQGNVAMGLEE